MLLVCFILGPMFLIGSRHWRPHLLTPHSSLAAALLECSTTRCSLAFPPTLPVTQSQICRSSVYSVSLAASHHAWSNGCGGAGAGASPSPSLQHHSRPPVEARCTRGGAARAAVVPQRRRLTGGRPTFRYPPARSAFSVCPLLEISEDLRQHPLVRDSSLCPRASSGQIQ